jgi:hypothetical protein
MKTKAARAKKKKNIVSCDSHRATMPGSEHNFATAVFDWGSGQADAGRRRGKMRSGWTLS